MKLATVSRLALRRKVGQAPGCGLEITGNVDPDSIVEDDDGPTDWSGDLPGDTIDEDSSDPDADAEEEEAGCEPGPDQ